MATAGDPIVVGAGESGLAKEMPGVARPSGRQRVLAAVGLVHPGPSLLVTAVTVAAGGLALGHLPPLDLAIRLVLIMLPAQFAIGTVNDLADLEADRRSKPAKPLVSGAVSRGAAAVVAGGCIAISLATAAVTGWDVLLLVTLGLGAGLAYDCGLKRSPLSVLCWWAGLAALPLAAYAAAGALTPGLWWEVPLAGLLALALLCANALPDLAADRAAGVDSIPVRLGEAGSRWVGLGAALVVSGLAVALSRPLGQSIAAVLVAAMVFAGVSAASLGNPAVRRPFPFIATATAGLAVTWFAALPR
jgi:4-hydroxybenzoate polyprenyltransferase